MKFNWGDDIKHLNLALCWFATSGVPQVKSESGPQYMEGKERLKKEADHSRLIGGRFKKQRTDIWGLSWAARQVDVRPLSTIILKVYREHLTGFSNVHYQDGLNNAYLFKAVSLKMSPTVGPVGESVSGIGGMRSQYMGQPVVTSSPLLPATHCRFQ